MPTPISGLKASASAASLRDSLIFSLEQVTSALAINPDTKVEPSALYAIDELLAAWAKYAEAISPSSPGYWARDLPEGTEKARKSAVHFMTILKVMNGLTPKDVPRAR